MENIKNIERYLKTFVHNIERYLYGDITIVGITGPNQNLRRMTLYIILIVSLINFDLAVELWQSRSKSFVGTYDYCTIMYGHDQNLGLSVTYNT